MMIPCNQSDFQDDERSSIETIEIGETASSFRYNSRSNQLSRMILYIETDDEDEDDRSSTETFEITDSDSSSGYHSQDDSQAKNTSKWDSLHFLDWCLILSAGPIAANILVLTVLAVNHSPDTHIVQPFISSVRIPPHQIPRHKNEAIDEKQHLEETLTSIAPGPCVNKYCFFDAKLKLKSIDLGEDPCEDFYGFACNQWIRENQQSHGRSIWNRFDRLEKRNPLLIRNILEKPFSYFHSEAEKKAKLYYHSCMDEDENIEKLGGDPMLDFIRDVGGWNISTVSFRIDEWSMEQTMKKMQNTYNVGGYISCTIREDNHIIQIYRSLALPAREHYLNASPIHQKVRMAYLEYMIKTGVLLGGEEFAVKRQMRDVLEFETKIAGLTGLNEEAMFTYISLRDVDELAPFMNLTSHFADALKTIGRKIVKDQRVILYAPGYLENLSGLVQEYQKTEKGRIVLNNYLVWQGVRTLTSRLSKPFRDAYKSIRKALLGSEETEETWRYCVGDTNDVFGFVVEAMFVREAFHVDAKPQAEKVINEVRDTFKKNLRKISWMDAQTRKEAEEKADAITEVIGFPEYILNSTQLDEKYIDLQLKVTEYFKNYLCIRQFNLKTNLEKLDTPVKKSSWQKSPSTVIAYYTPTQNQIVFPVGVLKKSFFDVHYPKCLNNDAMGMVMGHELTHAFDGLNIWLQLKSVEGFVKQTECMTEQYGDFQIIVINLNGKQSFKENIPDNGGLKAAFNKKYIKTYICI